MSKLFYITGIFLSGFIFHQGTDVKEILKMVKEKYDKVNDYTATGKLKTNILFIKAPIATVKVYYKKPDRLRIKNEKGVSLIPKGTVNINPNIVLTLIEYESFDGGKEKVNGKECRIIKIFPLDDKNDISRATLYIDETDMLVIKSVITSKENGTYELLLTYGSQKNWALPDKVNFTFNTKEFKLPKGISIDYDNGTERDSKRGKDKKGKVEIVYSSYIINQGVADKNFE